VLRSELLARLRARFAPLRRLFEAKWGFDHAFDWFAGRVVVDGSERVLWKRVDVGVIDAAVDGTGALLNSLADGVRLVQTGLVRGYVLVMLGGAVALLAYLLWMP